MSTQIQTPVQAISKSFDLHIDTQKQMTQLLNLINTQDEHIKLITTKAQLKPRAMIKNKIIGR